MGSFTCICISLVCVLGETGPGRGSARSEAATQEGPAPELKEAIELALEWLVRHQGPDGAWRARHFTHRCIAEGSSCATGDHDPGQGDPCFDIGVTALALLAFTGHGYTHRTGERSEWAEVVDRAARFLIGSQVSRWSEPRLGGCFRFPSGENGFFNQVAAIHALSELLAVSHDFPLLEKPVADAFRCAIRRQRDDGSWGYAPDSPGDTILTAWMAWNLRIGVAAFGQSDIGRELSQRTQSVRGFIDSMVDPQTGQTAPGPGQSACATRRRLQAKGNYVEGLAPGRAALALLAELALGVPAGDRRVRALVRHIERHPPDPSQACGIDYFYWYFGTSALFFHGHGTGLLWGDRVREALLGSQRREGHPRGSWDPVDPWSPAGGRVYATAMGALTLEILYRYESMKHSLAQEAQGQSPRGDRQPTRKSR